MLDGLKRLLKVRKKKERAYTPSEIATVFFYHIGEILDNASEPVMQEDDMEESDDELGKSLEKYSEEWYWWADLYVCGYFVDELGAYLIATTYGKMYKFFISISGDVVTFSDPIEVVVEHKPIEQQRTMVYRDKETNELKIIGIASTATINRQAEIDTTKMYDSFEESFSESDIVPVINLRHVDNEKFEMGYVSGLFRVDNTLIIYGVIDETTELGKYAEKRLSKGDYGLSIEFIPLETEIETINGVKVRTFTKGVFVGVALLKEKDAASYMTGISVAKEKGMRMGITKDKARDTLLDFIGDATVVDDFLSEVDLREKKIREDGLVTREQEVEQITETESETVVDLSNLENATIVIELDEETEKEITQTLINSEEFANHLGEVVRSNTQDAITQLTDLVAQLTNDVNQLRERIEKRENDIMAEKIDSIPVNRLNQKIVLRKTAVEKVVSTPSKEIVEPVVKNGEFASSIQERRKSMLNKTNTTNKIDL